MVYKKGLILPFIKIHNQPEHSSLYLIYFGNCTCCNCTPVRVYYEMLAWGQIPAFCTCHNTYLNISNVHCSMYVKNAIVTIHK